MDNIKGAYTSIPKDDNTKEYRKKIGLPINKQLLYKNPYAKSTINVVAFEILKEYNVSDYWSVLKLYLENGEWIKIHSAYFKSMQSPTFFEDREKEKANS